MRKNPVCHAPYLRNHVSYDFLFMVLTCKMMISPGVFFHFFKILTFCVVRVVKEKKIVQNDKNSVFHAPYLRNLTLYDCHLCDASVKWWYLLEFSSFSKILIFQVVSGVKGQKITQNDNCCASYFRKHTPYDCDFWYTLVKWWHLLMLFSFFQNFVFLGC